MSRKVTKAKGVKQAKSRVREAVFKSSETGKNRRKQLRPMKKGYSDKGKEKKRKGLLLFSRCMLGALYHNTYFNNCTSIIISLF